MYLLQQLSKMFSSYPNSARKINVTSFYAHGLEWSELQFHSCEKVIHSTCFPRKSSLLENSYLLGNQKPEHSSQVQTPGEGCFPSMFLCKFNVSEGRSDLAMGEEKRREESFRELCSGKTHRQITGCNFQIFLPDLF